MLSQVVIIGLLSIVVNQFALIIIVTHTYIVYMHVVGTTLYFSFHSQTFMTRPQTSVPEHPTRLEDPSNTEDGVLCVAKVLSNVQQARVDIELECALAEAQEHYTDLGKLLHSAETSNNYEE